ncbi:YlxR family protein [Amycolatopsis alkalitolerans]|uniref:YlxR family protein n=1 Tax=Amycolatopsis alkalitolerans TaxID=2547244 RepID=UPI001F3DD57F|nr:YlxR family protein [Amycolatopsis alkalitolerans]
MVAKDGQVVVDERRRLPGRGAWLHPDPGCLAKAERRRAFPRALRSSGTLGVEAVRRYLRPHAG